MSPLHLRYYQILKTNITSYHVAEPNSYLVITGIGIEGLNIKKKAWIWPFQKVTKISVTPFDFSIKLSGMKMEKLQFVLPAVFTIGPRDEYEALVRYATLLTGKSDGSPHNTANDELAPVANHVQDIVKGIIEGEIRSIVASLSMEQLFRERQVFKTKVIQSVQSELDQFGFCIYNANVKELQDAPGKLTKTALNGLRANSHTIGSEYFSHLSRKAHEGASNQAKIDVSSARTQGDIGEAEQQGRAKQEIAKINAATAVLETKRKAEKATADAELTGKEVGIEKELALERIVARRIAETKDAELQKHLEVKRAEIELERQRATTVTSAKIARESAAQRAQAELFSSNTTADAAKYKAQANIEVDVFRTTQAATAEFQARTKGADALRYEAEAKGEADFVLSSKAVQAEAIRETQMAEALLAARAKEAQACYLEAKAQADGLMEMAKAYGAMSEVLGGPQNLMQYLHLKDGTYEKLAKSNAQAIQGLQPKINVWNTGSSTDATDTMAPIRNLFQCLPPMLSTINDQTGLAPPAWLMQMPPKENTLETRPKQMTNGYTDGV